MKSLLLLILISFGPGLAHSQEKKDSGVVNYQYKKYEKFDLGSLEIKGSVIAPGDLSIQERERKRFKTNLMDREDFDDLIEKDFVHTR